MKSRSAREHHAQARADLDFIHVGGQGDGVAVARIGVGRFDVEHGRVGRRFVGRRVDAVAQCVQRLARIERGADHGARRSGQGGVGLRGARGQVVAVVVLLVVQHRVRFFDLHRNAQRPHGHVRRQRGAQRLENAFTQGGFLRIAATMANAQHDVDKGVVGVAVNDQAVVDAQGTGARAGQGEQAAVADGGVLHRAHQRVRIQGQIARILNPDMGHGVIRQNC
ncbi:hypothetical protein D3C87_1442100 [compost metagenome]